MRVSRRIRYPLAAMCALALTGVASCGDSSGPRIESHVGEYQLTTINGGGLPAIVFSSPAGRITINSATMSLRQDRSYREVRNYSAVDGAGQSTPFTESEDGQYSIVGSQITFSIPESGGNAGFSFSGAVSGGVIEYTFDGIAYRYQIP